MTHPATPIAIRPAEVADCESLRPVLENTVLDRDSHEVLYGEIKEILASVSDSVTRADSSRRYLVAESAGKVVGMMGLSTDVDTATASFAETDSPIEIINAYVDPSSRSKGAGRALVGALVEIAATDGATEVILNSGPRYQEFGWRFWRKMFGEPVGVAVNRYGEDAHAPVWSKKLQG